MRQVPVIPGRRGHSQRRTLFLIYSKGWPLFGIFSFKGGVHPPHSKKATEHKAIEPFPAPGKVIIPLAQHIGAPAKPAVSKGDEVTIGQVIGEAGGFVSAPVHASVSGTVTAITTCPHPLGRAVPAVEIENDGRDAKATPQPVGTSWESTDPKALAGAVSQAGIVGMGGASFPTHVKLSPPEGKTVDTLIINGAECEPYLTADHRLMLEKTDELVEGTLILRRILGVRHCYIGIETNKPDAIKAVSQALSRRGGAEIKLARLRTKYPQGGEKQLINAVTGRQVPSGGLPMDCGCVVQNVGTACAVRNAVVDGTPLYERVVTVTGPTVREPKNLLVRIGTPVRLLLEACQVDLAATNKVVLGGPMMGLAQADVDVPVVKSTSGVLCLDSETPGERSYDCIWCGNCFKACPIHLVPSRFAKLVEAGKHDEAEEWGIMDCMECGSCAFVCPAKINLVHYVKLGKSHVQSRRKAAKKEAAQ
ncbi:MAG: electron transport complex subunit RsxC [Chitinivibrionales bacterium]|nr:electron transport complex subunit RsxC [Chitinivibrionales bacterium]